MDVAATRMQIAGMHRHASASSDNQICEKTAQDSRERQHAAGNLRDAGGAAVHLAEPDEIDVYNATHGSPAVTEGDAGASDTPSGTTTPLSSSRVTGDSNSTNTAGPAKPAQPLQMMPSLGAALARFARTSHRRPDHTPDADAPREILPLGDVLARLTRASLERMRQLRRTASNDRDRSGDSESTLLAAGKAGDAEGGAAGLDGSGVLLGGELLVTVLDAQVIGDDVKLSALTSHQFLSRGPSLMWPALICKQQCIARLGSANNRSALTNSCPCP